MGLSVVPVLDGRAPLGKWGVLEVEGANSATLRLTQAENFPLPSEIAQDVTGGTVVLNEQLGRLLFLPYLGGRAITFDLVNGGAPFLPIEFQRDEDPGLRTASARVLPSGEVLYLSEASAGLWAEDCTPLWNRRGDYTGWVVTSVGDRRLVLSYVDLLGRAQLQVLSMVDGTLLLPEAN